jgi:hypothetical protein
MMWEWVGGWVGGWLAGWLAGGEEWGVGSGVGVGATESAVQPCLQPPRHPTSQDFVRQQISSDEFDGFTVAVMTSTRRDAELQEIINNKNPKFAVSMLQSQRDIEIKKVEELDQIACKDLESERIQVHAATFSWVKKGLAQDHKKLREIGTAKPQLALLFQQYQRRWQEKQAAIGESAIKSCRPSLTQTLLSNHLSSAHCNELREDAAAPRTPAKTFEN